MKGEFSSKRIALEVDVIGPENILLADASVHLSARTFFTAWGREGVNNHTQIRCLIKIGVIFTFLCILALLIVMPTLFQALDRKTA